MENVKILIVEDNHEVRKSIIKLLSASRSISTIYEAENTGTAMKIINKLSPAVTILDLNLNGENGIGLIPEIKNVSDSKIIVLTNETSKAIKKKCLKDGADYFIDKSLEFDLVFPSVQYLINNN